MEADAEWRLEDELDGAERIVRSGSLPQGASRKTLHVVTGEVPGISGDARANLGTRNDALPG